MTMPSPRRETSSPRSTNGRSASCTVRCAVRNSAISARTLGSRSPGVPSAMARAIQRWISWRLVLERSGMGGSTSVDLILILYPTPKALQIVCMGAMPLDEALRGGAGAGRLESGAPLAYIVLMAGWLVTVAETPLFVRQAAAVWGDDERFEFISFIAANPEAGDLIPDTGGVRKVRWSVAGSGKRGGVRVVYYYHDARRPLYLLLVYAKARQEDLSPDEKRAVRELTARLKGKRK